MAHECDGEGDGEVFETPPQPAAAKRTGSRIRMDPEYAAALRRLCEAPTPLPTAPGGAEATGGTAHRAGAHANERANWTDQYRLLVQRELLLARTVLPSDLDERELAADFAPILHLGKQRAAERTAERAARDKALRTLREGVRQARELVQRAAASPSYMAELRTAIEHVEAQIARARANDAHSTAALARMESELSAELAEHESNFEVWPALAPARAPGTRVARPGSAPPGAPSRSGALGSASAADAAAAAAAAGDREHPQLTAAIAHLDAQLDRLGGPTCGWPDEEHAAFVRARAQLGGVQLGSERLLHVAALRLPGFSIAELKAHADALARREQLLDEKRAAVAAWRAARATTDARRAARERTMESELAARRAADKAKVERAAARARAARDAQLDSWKEHRAAELATAQASQAAAEEEVRRRRERDARDAARLRADVEAAAAQRAAEKALIDSIAEERARAEAASARRANADELRRLRERDQRLIASAVERRQERERRVASERERAALLQQKARARARRARRARRAQVA
ncbi:hypothetical protein KFE25_002774 [Diacronema lutheri]|uniref:Uncharacterized protein n=1 Tax=Diacronema lutheri TaxID=2081491 RepID=A0A8J5XNY5_DIALT|nr:hypothetical protein KFE25_002774 [Diacronema lutheri]